MTRARLVLALGFALATTPLLAAPAAAADHRAEAAARDALKRAANDYLSTDYATAAARLQRAVRGCGATRCTAATRAALLRDLGTMQFHQGDVGLARKSWAEAVKAQPDIDLNPDYDAPDLRAVWNEVKGGASAGPSAPAGGGGGAQPSGDFAHAPAAEQKVKTPLPVYVEYPGSSTVARVVVKYKGATATDWSRLTLKRMGSGWGAEIPCGEVTRGTMRYYVQGFDEGGNPIANSGDPRHPYTVPIHDDIAGEAPHLPGKAAPKACGEEAHEAEPEEEATGEEAAPRPRAAPGAYVRYWVGVAGVLPEFASMPGVQAACKLQPSGAPANDVNYYCTNPNGTDFPSRQGGQNAAITNPNEAGNVQGGIHPGDVRIMAAFDYALSASFLVGGRVGFVTNSYPGEAASRDGKAFGSRLHLEGRATYLFGDAPLAQTGFAPMVFAGLGISEFDVHTTSVVSLNNVAGQQPVQVWLTDGPFFFDLGAGVRYQFSPRAAFTAAARGNAVIGGNGFLLTYGPEFGFLYGF